MAKKDYTWFIEPRNDILNQTVSADPRNSFVGYLVCSDGKKHPLWECPFDFCLSLWRSRKGSALNFKLFNREGPPGRQIRECFFLFSKKRKKGKQKTVN